MIFCTIAKKNPEIFFRSGGREKFLAARAILKGMDEGAPRR
jgi:hypothetical protein